MSQRLRLHLCLRTFFIFVPLLAVPYDFSHKRQGIPTTFNLDSVNKLIEILLDNYEAPLTADERREVKTLLEGTSK